MQQLVIKIAALLLSLIGALIICLFLAEKVFFNQLLYKKSWLHGYDFPYYFLAEKLSWRNWPKQWLHNRRVSDIMLLTEQINHPTLSNACQTMTAMPVRKSASHTNPLRVVIIGDSVAYGLGLRQTQRYAQLLENKLHKVGPAKVYVLAEPGNSLEEHYQLYALAKDYLNPDIIIVSILENDLPLNQELRYPNSAYLHQNIIEKCGQNFIHVDLDPQADWEKILEDSLKSLSPHYSNLCAISTISSLFRQDPRIFYFNLFMFPDQKYCKINSFNDACLHQTVMNTYQELLGYPTARVVGLNAFQGVEGISDIEQHPSAQEQQRIAHLLFTTLLGF